MTRAKSVQSIRTWALVALALLSGGLADGALAARSVTPAWVARDSHGRIARSVEAKDAFEREHPCPATGRPRGACPGYVIDHIVPLKRGGADAPANMQWQTIKAAKIKDRTE